MVKNFMFQDRLETNGRKVGCERCVVRRDRAVDGTQHADDYAGRCDKTHKVAAVLPTLLARISSVPTGRLNRRC
jgi:hypothetical protein